MHENFPIAIASRAADRRNGAMNWKMAVCQFFRPGVLAFVALALAVGGCGYGYKLSQYFHHSDVTKPNATRMWAEHRDDSFGARAHQRPSPQKFQSPQFSYAGSLGLPHFSRDLVFAAPVQSRILTFVSPLHPLRAPPSLRSSLA